MSTEIPDYGLCKCGDVVAHAVTRLGVSPGTHIIADNWFMSPSLLKWRTARDVGLTGTLQGNRLGAIPLPETLIPTLLIRRTESANHIHLLARQESRIDWVQHFCT